MAEMHSRVRHRRRTACMEGELTSLYNSLHTPGTECIQLAVISSTHQAVVMFANLLSESLLSSTADWLVVPRTSRCLPCCRWWQAYGPWSTCQRLDRRPKERSDRQRLGCVQRSAHSLSLVYTATWHDESIERHRQRPRDPKRDYIVWTTNVGSYDFDLGMIFEREFISIG